MLFLCKIVVCSVVKRIECGSDFSPFASHIYYFVHIYTLIFRVLDFEFSFLLLVWLLGFLFSCRECWKAVVAWMLKSQFKNSLAFWGSSISSDSMVHFMQALGFGTLFAAN